MVVLDLMIIDVIINNRVPYIVANDVIKNGVV